MKTPINSKALVSPVDSSVIAGASYSAQTRRLVVNFHSGAIWGYSRCSKRLFNELVSAPSAGAVLNQRIKPNHFARRLSR